MTIKPIDELREQRPFIDLTGPNGNVNFLMAQVAPLCEQLDRSTVVAEQIVADMKSSDYEHAVQIFDGQFGEYVTLYR